MKLKLASIKPNPYRDFTVNPLRPNKIAALKKSIEDTGFWKYVCVRKANDDYEAVFGHHRLTAAMELGIKEADLEVIEADDALVIKMMAHENGPEYMRSDVLVQMESVQAVVRALAAGVIPPFKHSKDTPKSTLRYAPSYLLGEPCTDSVQGAYTVADVAIFLGRTKNRSGGGSVQPSDEILAAFRVLTLMNTPGFTVKELLNNKKYSRDGMLLADVIIHDADMAAAQAKKITDSSREQRKRLEHQQQEYERLKLEQQAKAADAKAAEDRALKEAADAERNRQLELAAQRKTEADQKEKERKEHEAKMRDLQDKEEKIEEKLETARKKEQAQKAKDEQDQQKRWDDSVLALINSIARIFTPEVVNKKGDVVVGEDPLYAKMKRLRESDRLTEKQRGLIALALRDASNRFAQFNPHKTAASAKEDKAMGELMKKRSRKK
jgi:hypothetical protein